MDDPFVGTDGEVGETKSGAASRLIIDFFESRTNDMVGVVTFSNSAMFVLPLTQNKDAIKAAVNATAGNALFQTNIGAGLSSSAALFKEVADSISEQLLFALIPIPTILFCSFFSLIEFSMSKPAIFLSFTKISLGHLIKDFNPKTFSEDTKAKAIHLLKVNW